MPVAMFDVQNRSCCHFLTAKAPFTGAGLHGCGALLWVSTSGIEVLEPQHVWTCHLSPFLI